MGVRKRAGAGTTASVPGPRMGGEPLVVYVDGTPSGRDAVAWAIREASRRGVPVRILSSRAPGQPHAAGASMIVVGSASFLAMSDLAQGSVAMDVAVHADVPVVVVRPGLPDAEPGPSAGRIVVGVDGTPLSHAAIDFALAEARACGCGVTAVHAVERADQADTGRAVLDRLAAAHPEVRPVVAVGMASKALIAESVGARLLVVGSRGGAGLRGMLLGSVSQAVVHRARCPVAVVRDGGRATGGLT